MPTSLTMASPSSRQGADRRLYSRTPVSPRQDAEAIVLDFVEPARSGRRRLGWGWQARLDKADYSVLTL